MIYQYTATAVNHCTKHISITTLKENIQEREKPRFTSIPATVVSRCTILISITTLKGKYSRERENSRFTSITAIVVSRCTIHIPRTTLKENIQGRELMIYKYNCNSSNSLY